MVPKLCTTRELIFLADQAEQRGYNRQLDVPRLAADLDPLAMHALIPLMLHQRAQCERVLPHVRARVLFKVRDSAELPEAILDIGMFSWNTVGVAVPEDIRD